MAAAHILERPILFPYIINEIPELKSRMEGISVQGFLLIPEVLLDAVHQLVKRELARIANSTTDACQHVPYPVG